MPEEQGSHKQNSTKRKPQVGLLELQDAGGYHPELRVLAPALSSAAGSGLGTEKKWKLLKWVI